VALNISWQEEEMSQEVFKLTIGGDTRWRCCNESSGYLSLDGVSLTPLDDSVEVSVERMLDTDGPFSGPERNQERDRLIKGYGKIEEYLQGRYVVDLDAFFEAIERLTSSEVANDLGLSEEEIKYLTEVATVARLELSNSEGWRSIAEVLNAQRELSENLYLKLFPDYDPAVGSIGHPKLLSSEIRPLEAGLKYVNFLVVSCELDGVAS
jgi:hypothetical protein